MGWFTVTPVSQSDWQISESIGAIEPRFGVRTVNMHLVAGSERAALIDTGMGIGDLRSVVEALTSLPIVVCNTHFHWDHSAGNRQFEQLAIHESEAKLLSRPQDMKSLRAQMQKPEVRALLPDGFVTERYEFTPTQATRTLADGDAIDLGGRVLQVLHTPGHSFGHVVYWDEDNGLLFSGDTAYRGPLYACFRGGDPAAFCSSARRLAALGERVQCILPGHNETLRDMDFLLTLARAAEDTLNGRVALAPPDDFIGGREAQFDGFSIWMPK